MRCLHRLLYADIFEKKEQETEIADEAGRLNIEVLGIQYREASHRLQPILFGCVAEATKTKILKFSYSVPCKRKFIRFHCILLRG